MIMLKSIVRSRSALLLSVLVAPLLGSCQRPHPLMIQGPSTYQQPITQAPYRGVQAMGLIQFKMRLPQVQVGLKLNYVVDAKEGKANGTAARLSVEVLSSNGQSLSLRYQMQKPGNAQQVSTQNVYTSRPLSTFSQTSGQVVQVQADRFWYTVGELLVQANFSEPIKLDGWTSPTMTGNMRARALFQDGSNHGFPVSFNLDTNKGIKQIEFTYTTPQTYGFLSTATHLPTITRVGQLLQSP